MHDRLQSTLKQLHLSGLAQSLDVRLQEAAGHSLNHAEFLELVLQDEILIRSQRVIEWRVKMAQFRELKSLDDFEQGSKILLSPADSIVCGIYSHGKAAEPRGCCTYCSCWSIALQSKTGSLRRVSQYRDWYTSDQGPPADMPTERSAV